VRWLRPPRSNVGLAARPCIAVLDMPLAAINVAGPAALLVAKLHKLGERKDAPHRLIDKHAYDVYRLLVATDTRRSAPRCANCRPTSSPELRPGRRSAIWKRSSRLVPSCASLASLYDAGPARTCSSIWRGERSHGRDQAGEPIAAVSVTSLLGAIFRVDVQHRLRRRSAGQPVPIRKDERPCLPRL
jgi:hypothetical protein